MKWGNNRTYFSWCGLSIKGDNTGKYLAHSMYRVYVSCHWFFFLILDKSNSVNFSFITDKMLSLNNVMSTVFCGLQSLKCCVLCVWCLHHFYTTRRGSYTAGHTMVNPVIVRCMLNYAWIKNIIRSYASSMIYFTYKKMVRAEVIYSIFFPFVHSLPLS